MQTTNINIRTNVNLKKKAENIYNKLGLNMSMAINLFLVESVRTRSLPLSLKLDKPNETTIKALEDAKNDKNLYGPFDSVDELLESLNA